MPQNDLKAFSQITKNIWTKKVKFQKSFVAILKSIKR